MFVPILVKIDQEMRPWECSQTERYTDRLTDANRSYNLSHVICYSYGADKNIPCRLGTAFHKRELNLGQVAVGISSSSSSSSRV